MTLPEAILDAQRIGGGDINETWRVVLDDGREAFVKTREGAAPDEYAVEAAGLEWLSAAGGLRTPQVIEIDSRYLVLEWIHPGDLDLAGARELGSGLAITHDAGAPVFGVLEDPRRPTVTHRFGSLELSNEPTSDWPSFYALRRLLPLARLGRDRGAIGEDCARAVERICERIVELSGPQEAPSRLHGDLWRGNVLAGRDGRPWLIDPNAYGGHREVDLAMFDLFGPGGPIWTRVVSSYIDASPLAAEWEGRVALWQLAPLLVHAILFGGGYGAWARKIALRYGG